MSIEIIKPGIFTTIQDIGRNGYRAIGIGPGGAMDFFAASVANFLVGNDNKYPVIEMHFPGAHPSFPDKENFGRAAMDLTSEKIRQIVKEQLNTLNRITVAAGGRIHHVKPHGALYNMAAKNALLAISIAEAVNYFDSSVIYYGLSGSVMINEAAESGLRVAHEVFADRTYQADGSLTSRSAPGALITDAGQVIFQVMQIINEKMVTATSGEKISIKADTVCIHGDGSNAVEFAKRINNTLIAAGIQIRKIE